MPLGVKFSISANVAKLLVSFVFGSYYIGRLK